jgi:hypothetical protein
VLAVQPITRDWEAGPPRKKVQCSRKQLPLDLAFAKSIHKGQGMTIGEGEDVTEGVLDLGEKELDLGMTYVGISRFKALFNFKIFHPTWDRFYRIGAKRPSDAKRAALLARDAEATRVGGLVAATKERHSALWQRCVDWAYEVSNAQSDEGFACSREALVVEDVANLPIPAQLASITEETVERELNRIFSAGCDDCLFDELLTALGVSQDDARIDAAVVEVLERMEAANKVMYDAGDRNDAGDRLILLI